MRLLSRALGATPLMMFALFCVTFTGAADAAEGNALLNSGASVAQIPTSLPPPAPTPRPTDISPAKACRRLARKVPASAIDAALANPGKIGGYNRLRDENKPASPMNPRQIYLTLCNPNVQYDAVWNPLCFKAGCP